MDDLARFDKNRKYLFLDCETEHLNLYQNKPWEIGLSLWQNDKFIHEEVIYIKWEKLEITEIARKLTKYDTKIHLIERDGITPKEACDKISNFIYDKDIYSVGSNLLGFDIHVLNYLRRVCGKNIDYTFTSRIYDTVAIVKAMILGFDPPENQSENIFWQYRIMNDPKKVRSGIKGACNFLDVEYDENAHHDAIADNRMTQKIFQKAIKTIDIK